MPIEVACPSCDRLLRVPDDLLGRLVKCPSCGDTFTATQPEPSPPTQINERGEIVREGPEPGAIRAEEDTPAPVSLPRPPIHVPDLDDEDYPYRTHRGSARSQVNAPASALQVVGILACALSLLSLALHVVLAVAGLPNDPRPDEERIANMVGGVVGALFGLAWAGLILYGAHKMKTLENYGLAMAASIVAMLPCNGCCILGLPFGIWALVVLNRPDVRDAFH
jgi:predicted Zn finger-like uncharacterized protein